MKPLLVLSISFLVSTFILWLVKREYDLALSGRIAMSTMLVFVAIGHFVFAKGMSAMLPDFIPSRELIVHITGIMEIMFAVGLLIPGYRHHTAWALIVFLLLILPANIYAAMHNINYQTGAFDGNGLGYLWFRIPLQVFFIIWIYVSAIRF